MGDALATPADLVRHWDDAGEVPTTVQQASLDFASALLRDKVYKIDDRLADGTLDPIVVRGIVCEMVRRHLADPITTEQMEDTTFRLDTSWMAGGIYPTAAELDTLKPKKADRGYVGAAHMKSGLAPVRSCTPVGAVW